MRQNLFGGRNFPMNWNRIFVYAAAVVLLSLVTGAIAACAPQRGAPAPAVGPGETGFPKMTLKFNHVVARDTPKHKAAERFAQLVRERTNGAIGNPGFPQLGTLQGRRGD
jgi:TRAP-type C4-dicarboxylate transport system substrate-binding protein